MPMTTEEKKAYCASRGRACQPDAGVNDVDVEARAARASHVAEERHAWAGFLSSMMAQLRDAERAASEADAMLVAYRVRFPAPPEDI